MLDDVLDESLQRLAMTGPEYGSGLSNHGPMAAEALVRLGRPDVVEVWVTGYLRKLDDQPRSVDPIGSDWQDALGAFGRVADWDSYFQRQLDDTEWRTLLNDWWPRLIPGLAAGATHGIIRTAHAARALAEQETPQRRGELANALAYWAARYTTIAGTPCTAGTLDLPNAIASLPVVPEVPPDPLTDRLTGIEDLTGFPAAVAALRPPTDPAASLQRLSQHNAHIFLTHGRRQPIALIHMVTAPVAARSIFPLLAPTLWRQTYDALWQISAALYATNIADAVPEPVPNSDPLAPDDLVERAVATGDEHAIKFTEACLRENSQLPDPTFRHAALRASELLGRDD